ncbi:hypothetical protein [Ruminococcus albus]|uniref:hypothetical protein n=1 Tax=Ruminococcus albus TaxID=1264 RepID=UPI0004ADC8A6|nr:hypothetical protein [Ruminococcus albus]
MDEITRLSAGELSDPLSLLESLNYIRTIEQRSGQKGRPKVTIYINPNIYN